MNVEISVRHHEQINEELKDFVLKKIGKLDRYLKGIETVHVIFNGEKASRLCEIVLFGKHVRLTATETTTDSRASFDQALDNIQNQLRKHHEKITYHAHRKIELGEE